MALCDPNRGRAQSIQAEVESVSSKPVLVYSDRGFETTISEQAPDEIIVTTGPGRTYSDYFIRAPEPFRDVIGVGSDDYRPGSKSSERSRQSPSACQRVGRRSKLGARCTCVRFARIVAIPCRTVGMRPWQLVLILEGS